MYGNQPIKTSEMQIQWPVDLKEGMWVATPKLVLSCFLQGGTRFGESFVFSSQSDQMWMCFLSEYVNLTAAVMLNNCQISFWMLSHLHFFLTFPELSLALI